MGLRLLPAAPNESEYPILTDKGLILDTQAALKDTGVKVADVEIIRITPDYDGKKYLQFLEVAEQLGAKHILIAGNDAEHNRLIESGGLL